jgi:dihydroorotate dehydrogenase
MTLLSTNLISRAVEARSQLREQVGCREDIPILIKIAPDLTDEHKRSIAELALHLNVDGIIISNTTGNSPLFLL